MRVRDRVGGVLVSFFNGYLGSNRNCEHQVDTRDRWLRMLKMREREQRERWCAYVNTLLGQGFKE